MILKVIVSVRNSPWPSGGETHTRLHLEQEIADTVIEVLRERRASLKSIEFVQGRS